MAQLSLEHSPDIFAVVCCNDSFQLALDLNTIKTLLRVCKRVRPLLSFKLARFHTWCQKAELCRSGESLQIGLTPSETIALSLHCENQDTGSQSWLVALADQGNASASYLLARVLQIELHEVRAVDYRAFSSIKPQFIHRLKSAADSGHPMAQFYQAGCFLSGSGFDRDHAKAVELYRSLADRRIPRAQVALGRCYENGEGVDQDFDSAIEWYSKAANQGSEDGRLHIVFLQAWFSFIGRGVEPSDIDAFNRWQEVSIQSTDPIIKPIATHMVGWMHYLGRGTQRSQEEGAKLIRESKSKDFPLEEDNSLAGFNHGSSHSPASRKFHQLCELGSERDWLCKHLMAVCLMNGLGTAEDAKKAAGMFEQLAIDGHSDSQVWIGRCCFYGRGISEDKQLALEWFSESARQGNSYGQWKVGVCYSNGYGTAEDVAKAAEWYRRSAEQGNRYGQGCLGVSYLDGRGIAKDIDTAVFWLRKAADQGHGDATNRLKTLNM